jgi:hypothetical protein
MIRSPLPPVCFLFPFSHLDLSSTLKNLVYDSDIDLSESLLSMMMKRMMMMMMKKRTRMMMMKRTRMMMMMMMMMKRRQVLSVEVI